MSGTGWGARSPKAAGDPTSAEHHLGDRLAALVDGELGHDARERVLAHLATCRSCKAEADAQRRLKNVFADTAPPAPSDGLLARLQGLPAGPPTGPDGDDGPGDGSGGAGGFTPAAAVGARGASPWDFEYLPGGGGRSALSPSRGFRIHETAERDIRPPDPSSAVTSVAPQGSASRGRRFAFAAAGAFSLAALALGGGALGGAGSGTQAAGDNASASPVRSANSGAASDGRRRGGEKNVPGPRAGKAERGGQRASGASSTAPPASSPQQPGSLYPLLHTARFSAPFTSPVLRPALPTATAGARSAAPSTAPSASATGQDTSWTAPAPSYGSAAYGTTMVGAVPGRTPAGGAQSAASPVPQQR